MSIFNEITKETMDHVFSPVLAEEMETTQYKYISFRNLAIFTFSGSASPLTPTCQDELQIPIDGKLYSSIDEYLWENKFLDLTGSPATSDNHFRGDLGRRGVSVPDLENWILKRGILYMQKAILCKLQNDPSFYQLLMCTGQKYIVYTYIKENFYAAGTAKNDILEWARQAKESNFYVRIPMRFPLIYNDLHIAPIMPNDGHNVLGLIYMAIREAILTKGLHNLSVEIPPRNTIIPENVRLATERHVSQVLNKKKRKQEEQNLPNKRYNPYPSPAPISTEAQNLYTQTSLKSWGTYVSCMDPQNNRARSKASTFYPPNTMFNNTYFPSRASSSRYSKQSNYYQKIKPKQEHIHGDTYSTMSTPAASSVGSTVLNIRNWQTSEQIELVQKAFEEEEERRLANDNEYYLNDEDLERQQLAQQALEDEEFTRRLLSSERTENQSLQGTPAHETKSSNLHLLNKTRKIKREIEDNVSEEESVFASTSSKRRP